jgi:hypothetical protein
MDKFYIIWNLWFDQVYILDFSLLIAKIIIYLFINQLYVPNKKQKFVIKSIKLMIFFSIL